MKNYWSDCFSRSVLNGILSAILIELTEAISYYSDNNYFMFMLIPIFFSNFILMQPKYKDTFGFAFVINFISYICAEIVFLNSVSLYNEKLSAGSGFALMWIAILCYICSGFAMLLSYIFAKKEIRDENSNDKYIKLTIMNFVIYCLIGLILLIVMGAMGVSFMDLEVRDWMHCSWLCSAVVGMVVAAISLKKTNSENIFEEIMWLVFNVILFFVIFNIEMVFYVLTVGLPQLIKAMLGI
jgi:H+/Cl- antiporter ClcA